MIANIALALAIAAILASASLLVLVAKLNARVLELERQHWIKPREGGA